MLHPFSIQEETRLLRLAANIAADRASSPDSDSPSLQTYLGEFGDKREALELFLPSSALRRAGEGAADIEIPFVCDFQLSKREERFQIAGVEPEQVKTEPEHRKILIVYETMGTGHLRMANIIEDILRDDRLEIVKAVGSVLCQSSGADLTVFLWNYLLQKKCIYFLDILVNFLFRLLLLPVSEVEATGRMMDNVEALAPSLIICTSDCYNKILGQYTLEHQIPFYTVITDIAIFIDLVSVNATPVVYFPETVEAVQSYDFRLSYFAYVLNRETRLLQKFAYVGHCLWDFVLMGFRNSIYRDPGRPLVQRNQARCQVIGPLAESKHFRVKNAVALKKKYDLPAEGGTLMIVSGGYGGRFVTDVVKKLCRSYERPDNLLAMCGRSQVLLQEMTVLKERARAINILPYSFTDQFDEFLAMTDCLIFRPSAGIFIESLLSKTPCVVLEPALSNDRGTLAIINKHGTGEVCHRPEELVETIYKVLDNNRWYRQNIEELLSKYPRS